MPEASRLENFVGGRFLASASSDFVPDRNPSDREDVVGLVPSGAPEDVEAAVRAAEAALPAWK